MSFPTDLSDLLSGHLAKSTLILTGRCSTYCSRSRIGDPPLVLNPAVVRAFLVGEGAIKGCSDGSHGVNTDSRAPKYRARGGGGDRRGEERDKG